MPHATCFKQYCRLEWDAFLTGKIYPNCLQNDGKFLPVFTVSHPEASFLQVLGCIKAFYLPTDAQ
jgi:hypothetical protein